MTFVSARRQIICLKGFFLFIVLKLAWGGGSRICVSKKEQSMPYFKGLKELCTHIFEENVSQNYKLQHLLVISVNPFTNKWTHTPVQDYRRSEYLHLFLTFISKGRD